MESNAIRGKLGLNLEADRLSSRLRILDFKINILKIKLTKIKSKLETKIHTDIKFLPKGKSYSRDIKDELALVVTLQDLIETGDDHLINQYISSL